LHDSDSKALIADGIKKSNTKKRCPFFFHHLTESMDTHVHGGRPNSYVRLGNQIAMLGWEGEMTTGK